MKRMSAGWGRTMALALVTILGLFSSCAPAPNSPRMGELPRPESAIGRLEARRTAVRTLFMQGAISVNTPQDGALSGDHVIWGAYPDRIRADIFGPFGQPVLRLVADGDKLYVLAFDENRVYLGRSSRANIGAFLGAALSPDEIFALLSGNAPMLSHMNVLRILDGGDGTAELSVADSAALVQERISFRLDDYSVLRAELVQRDEQAEDYICLFDDFQDVAPWSYPKGISVKSGRDRSLSLDSDELVVNQPLPDNIFDTDQPEGVEIIWLAQ